MQDESRFRRSIRIPDYDYQGDGAYFITVCASGLRHLFGRIKNGIVRYSPLGTLVEDALNALPRHFDHVSIDEFVVMPNHLHMILVFHSRGTASRAPTKEGFGQPVAGSLPTVIRSLKSGVTRRWRKLSQQPEASVWQRGYFEHTIRDNRRLTILRHYIQVNPLRWRRDQHYISTS